MPHFPGDSTDGIRQPCEHYGRPIRQLCKLYFRPTFRAHYAIRWLNIRDLICRILPNNFLRANVSAKAGLVWYRISQVRIFNLNSYIPLLITIIFRHFLLDFTGKVTEMQLYRIRRSSIGRIATNYLISAFD